MSFSFENENEDKFPTKTWKRGYSQKRDKTSSETLTNDYITNESDEVSKMQGVKEKEKHHDDINCKDLEFEARGFLKFKLNSSGPHHCKEILSRLPKKLITNCQLPGSNHYFSKSHRRILPSLGSFEKKELMTTSKHITNNCKSEKTFGVDENLFDYEGKILKSIFKKKYIPPLEETNLSNFHTKNKSQLSRLLTQSTDRISEKFKKNRPKVNATSNLAKSAPYATDLNATKAQNCSIYSPFDKKVWE
ncbi:uncharacterized protein LOC124814130 [Hydra vulgaris]|uniref:uncharacterized protein LOC124814130 n=1 Tax=Hydra vulgaris TaxID=6087 RepID=UPI001F5EBA25|nr:uncharacterized protein LOC124814130 [Hydra vulgaris]